MLTRLTARHLRQPSGLVGRYFGYAMNRLNEDMNSTAIERLEVAPEHRVLDIGFGGGLSLALLDQRIDNGQVHGVEVSKTMLSRARREFRRQIASDRLVLTCADITRLPFTDNYFDRVCTINTLYFWPDVTQGLHEVRRVMKPGGAFVLCYRPKEVMEKLSFTRFDFQLYETGRVEELLAANGFRSTGHTRGQDAHLGYACVVALKEGN